MMQGRSVWVLLSFDARQHALVSLGDMHLALSHACDTTAHVSGFTDGSAVCLAPTCGGHQYAPAG